MKIDLQGPPPTHEAFQAAIELADEEVRDQARRKDRAFSILILGFAAGTLLVAMSLNTPNLTSGSWPTFAWIAVWIGIAIGVFLNKMERDALKGSEHHLTMLRKDYSPIDAETAVEILPLVESDPVVMAYAKAAAAQGRSLVSAEAAAVTNWPEEWARREALRKMQPEALLA